MKKKDPIQVFEYSKLKVTDKSLMDALVNYHGDKCPYYKLIHGGVQFNEYVGVIQVGQQTIEVLPKIDKESNNEDTGKWQAVLLQMMKQAGLFHTEFTSYAGLKLKSNSVLDLYFELFLSEVEYLLQHGLIKKYRKDTGNQLALKGSLQFAKHIQQNVVHQERFYVRHAVFDQENAWNQILYKVIKLLPGLCSSAELAGRIQSMLLRFPAQKDINVSEVTFTRLIFDRKAHGYKTAIHIARLILLNYHPDIISGRNNVLALMFDMNLLWEKWVLRQMKIMAPSIHPSLTVSGQESRGFWRPEKGTTRILRPDIILKWSNRRVVIDTKWKLPIDMRPAVEDIKQMFVYNKLFDSKESILLYPGAKKGYHGSYLDKEHHCGVEFLNILDESGQLINLNVGNLLNLIVYED